MQDIRLEAEAIALLRQNSAFLAGTLQQSRAHRLDLILGRKFGRTRLSRLLGGLVSRGGQLILHGQPVATPWTYLGESALAGDSMLQLSQSTDWQVPTIFTA